ncbi:MAG TPA: flagellar hook-basal body complex protein FliE [Burkholderiaceae bacterium]|jgi:flagellar hook-basal body complex protein FliE
MSLPIDFLPPVSAVEMPKAVDMEGAIAARGTAAAAPASGFGALVTEGLQSVNTDWVQAQQAVQDLATGHASNLHDVMMKMEESRISFQFFLQARNRLVESYQDLMRMQI